MVKNERRLTEKLAIGVVFYENSLRELARLSHSLEIATRILSQDHGIETLTLTLDNGGTQKLANEAFGAPRNFKIQTLKPEGNVGFARGINRLMEAAFSDQSFSNFIMLNPDGALHPNCLSNLIETHQRFPNALIEARQFPEEHPKDYNPKTLDTEWVSGACTLVPQVIYEAIGGLDTSFFMYMEDVDFSWRARAKGFQAKFCPAALFGHEVLARKPSRTADKNMLLSGRLLAKKWGDAKFVMEIEQRLLKEEFYQKRSELPKPAFNKAFKKPFSLLPWRFRPDFQNRFTFSRARWL